MKKKQWVLGGGLFVPVLIPGDSLGFPEAKGHPCMYELSRSTRACSNGPWPGRGGCGRRKLIVIPPEAEGYSAKNLKSVSSGGKAIFYVVPLQDSLDTSPLAPDSPHFSKMPKTTCYQCSEVMPLQMLAVHIKTCIGKLSSDDDREDQISDVWVVEDKSKISDVWVVEDKSKVEDAADTESLMMLADDIVSCGYTSQIKHELKESIIRSIVLHSTTRLIPILQQLKNGMQLYGLVDQLNKNSEVCKPLFVPGKITKPDADFIMMNCQPRYSEKGTSKQASERKVTNFFQDFLQELEVATYVCKAENAITVQTGSSVQLEIQTDKLPYFNSLVWMNDKSENIVTYIKKTGDTINAEFLCITTLHLQSRIMASLDRQSSQLLQVIMDQSLDIDIRRECLLKCLIMYLGEDASCLIKEYQADQREEAEREFEKTTMAFFVICESDALSCALDISIVTDGVEVLNELPSVACACAMMFGLIYALNLKYPEGLKYTFEAFQKVIVDMESKQMSRRVQNLSSKLQEYICFL
ncbi:G2/M phase-specific E3 ubiquitin-protein ligase-like isoform X1 [Labeo rohita]|uniref:G2/M phase-specific E3 ubiquitin-protein ligase-like isoform X1 n=1 Tax=Labeo rohita TaxID=84645 RepID=A0A498LFY1_LABRO|nr:G2/M phase-specific E3 ubiquitin-protein ligase-like isoform X1 [Labeo rohita]